MSLSSAPVIPYQDPVPQRETCVLRRLESAGATEFYLTATPAPGPIRRQAAALYHAVARALRREQAVIVAERLVMDKTQRELLAAIDRALAAFKDKQGWTKLMRNGMARNYSWEQPAKEYGKVYAEAARRRK